MISAEKLLDSLGNLPDDMIRQTEAIRSRKPVHWIRWTAVAACLCLCIGLWFAGPGATKSDSAAGNTQENGSPLEDKETATSIPGMMDAIVFSVSEDSIVVTTDQIIGQIPGQDGTTIQLIQFTVTFENLGQIPQLKSGQQIRIYYSEIDEEQQIMRPYKIEIINEQEVQE